jgi:CHAT domain-containing protein/tetratricopeptide (TPR) repeat protein
LQLIQALKGRALLLMKLGRGQESLPSLAELANLVSKRKDIGAEFTAYVAMAEIYQQSKDQTRAKEVLEKATSLQDPNTDVLQVGTQIQLEGYERLAEAEETLGDPLAGLIAEERALHVAHVEKDNKDEDRLIAQVRQKIDFAHLHDLSNAAFEHGELKKALMASEIIVVFEGASSESDWNRTTTIPFVLINQPGGSEALEEILTSMGPMLGISRLPLLDALGDFLQTASRDLHKAEIYTRQADLLTEAMNDSAISLKVRTACKLALILSQEGSHDQAATEVATCLDLANKSTDQSDKDRANATNTLVRAAANDLGAAESSLRYLLAARPDDATIHVGLANALAANDRYDEAVLEFQKAIQSQIQQGKKQAAADTYFQMGFALNNDKRVKDAKEPIDAFRSAHDLYEAVRAYSGEAKASLFEGLYFQKIKVLDKALESADEALSLSQKGGDLNVFAHSAWLKGDLLASSGQHPDALSYHHQAYESFKTIKDNNSAVLALLAVAQDQNALKEPADAANSCLTADTMLTPEIPITTRISVKRDLAWLYVEEGDFEKAIATFNEERDLAIASKDVSSEGYADVALSDTFQLIGSWDDALKTAQEGLQLFKNSGIVAGQASAEAQLMSLYCDRTSPSKDFGKATLHYEEAERLGYGPSLKLDFVEVYLQQHKYEEAIGLVQNMLAGCVKDKDVDCQAGSLISKSEAQRMGGDFKAAATTLQLAEKLVSPASDFYLRGRLLYGEANLQRSFGNVDEAVERYEQLIGLIDNVKGSITSSEQRSMLETYGFIYDELVEALYSRAQASADKRRQSSSEAFVFAEADKARQFAQAWGRTFVESMRTTLSPAVQEEELSLSMQPRRTDQADGDDVKSKVEARPVENNRTEFVRRIRAQYPAYAAIAYPEPVAIDELPLQSGETIAEFKVTTDATFVWLVGRDGVGRSALRAFYRVPRTREWLKSEIDKLREAIASGNQTSESLSPAESIFNALFPGEYAPIVLQSKEIIFIPDDILFLIPFEILSPSATAENFPLVGIPTHYYPSAAALKLASEMVNAHEWPETFLGIGDPITSSADDRFSLVNVLTRSGIGANTSRAKGLIPSGEPNAQMMQMKSRGLSFERLPKTATELANIAQLVREHGQIAETRDGLDATKENLIETDLTRFRYLHFATHGILPTDLDIPDPALVFSYDGVSMDDMLLPSSQVLKLRIRADSVVLSACNTGSGDVSRAEGVMSLGRAFLLAGASSVTVSLWEVDDDSTAAFMTKYYSSLLSGESKPQALAEARLGLIKAGYKDPYYWAPFILVGN